MNQLNINYNLFLMLMVLPFFIQAQPERDTSGKIFHYSTMDAMRNSIYHGDITINQLLQKGDFGLGTFNELDGELIVLDGRAYRIAADGSIDYAKSSTGSPFASVTRFKKDSTIMINGAATFASLQQKILQALPSPNRFYAIKIHTVLNKVKCGGARKVTSAETRGLATLMAERPIFEKSSSEGTVVGFYCPPFVGGIDLSPFHFHFISDDRRYGGHLIDGHLAPEAIIRVEIATINSYELVLPQPDERYDRQWKPTTQQNTY